MYTGGMRAGRPFWAWDDKERQFTTKEFKPAADCSAAIQSMTGASFTQNFPGEPEYFGRFGVPSGAGLRPNCSYLVIGLMHVATRNSDGALLMDDLEVQMMDVRPYYAFALKDSAKPKAAPPPRPTAPL
jgi:hypothetical protein